MLAQVCWQMRAATAGGLRVNVGNSVHGMGRSSLFQSTRSLCSHSSPRAPEQRHSIHSTTTCKRNNGSRPSLDDVERISKGQGAKARGTGSRRIPHRLNAEERQQYDIAKQKGFLTVKGTGYRKERKGSPLANTFRQWCDAQAKPCVVIEQGYGANAMDTVMVDVSTLRSQNATEDQEKFVSSASSLGYAVSEQNHRIPFTIEAWQEFGITNTADAAQGSEPATSSGSTANEVSNDEDNEQSAEEDMSASSSHKADVRQSDDQHQADGNAVQATATAPSASKQKKRLASSSPLAPIWTVQAEPVFFDAERPQAKELAKAFVTFQE